MTSRITAAVLTAAFGASALTACGTGSTGDKKDTPEALSQVDADAFPVTIEHAWGETEIEDEPQRVVTIGWGEHDYVLSLGVVPVGASKISWGGEENGSTAWFDAELEKLDAEAPVRIDDSAGIDVDKIAELEPDLVLATGWDMSQKDYERLTRTGADVVPYKTAPYTATWEESLDVIGKALGRSTRAAEVVEETNETLAAVGEEHPELAGKTFVFGGISTDNTSTIDVLTENDGRSATLIAMGLEVAPSIEDLTGPSKAFYETVSAERADQLASDIAIFIPYEEGVPLEEFTQLIEKDPLLSKIPAVAAGHWYTEVDSRKMLALSVATPLSIPFALDGTLGDIVDVAVAAE